MAIYMWRDVQIPADALYFEANTAGSTIYLQKFGNPTSINLETSTNGVNWIDYTIGDTITLSSIGDKVYIRNKSSTSTGFSTSSSSYYKFEISGNMSAYGDVNYLLCKNSTTTLIGDYCFYRLFNDVYNLVLPPKLPATTLTQYCYRDMFSGCISLTGMPSLPAITLSKGCYYQMFRNSSLIKLSSTQTGEYQTEYRMPTTGTGTTATDCFYNMFTSTGGTFKGSPSINTTYYTSNQVI